MKIRGNRRLLGLLLAPFALLTACVGLTPEEQAEYRELQAEVRRIQVEEIQPRQNELNRINEGRFVVDVAEIQARVNQIRNEKLEPLNKRLAVLKTSEQHQAAPGTRIELEELHARLEELELLSLGIKAQIEEHRAQLAEAKSAATAELQERIEALEAELAALLDELETPGDISDAQLSELEWSITDLKEEIAHLEAEIDSRHSALIDQFELLIHTLEVSLHDISEEREDLVRRIHELELSAPEELEKTISELELLIEEIVSSELRPLIEQLNEATSTGDTSTVVREQLRAEIEEWLTKLASLKVRLNELTAKSVESLIGGLDLGELAGVSS